MKVKFKKLHEDAVLPNYSHKGDAGLDLTATDSGKVSHPEGNQDLYYYIEYGTGLAMELDSGYVGLLFPRSSISKTVLLLANSVGVIDQTFKGEIKLRFKVDAGMVNQGYSVSGGSVGKYKKGDRIGQLLIVPYPTIESEFTDELSETERGDGGFGSTNERKTV
jgi:dUTP pyrophosphatase